MKILVITCVSDNPEINLYKGLADRGMEITIICDPRETRQEELKDKGIAVIPLKIRNRIDLKVISYLKSFLSTNDIDLIYAPTSRGVSTVLLATIRKQYPVITYRGTMGNLSRFSIISRLAHLNSRVTAIVCNCHGVRRYIESLGVSSDKLPVIYKGHDPEWYRSQSAVSREELGIKEDSFVVGCIANIRPLKGIDVLLQSIDLLKEYIDVELLLVGELRDSRIPKLISELELEEQVHLCGFRKDAAGIIKSCDLTVMPSVSREGIPRAIIESMSQGVPVVVSDTGGLPEMVEFGKTGYVVPAGDAEALAEWINRLGLDPDKRRELGQEARKLVEDRFGLNRYLDQYEELFKSAAF